MVEAAIIELCVAVADLVLSISKTEQVALFKFELQANYASVSLPVQIDSTDKQATTNRTS